MKNSNKIILLVNNIPIEEKIILDFNQTINLPDDIHYTFNILFLGESGAGKTSLINAMCDNSVRNNYPSTLGTNTIIKIYKLKDKKIKVKIFDIGKFDFDLNKDVIIEYFKISHACVYVVDVNNEESLSFVEKLTSLNPKSSSTVNYLILLNKIDENSKDCINKENSRVSSIMNCSCCSMKKLCETFIRDISYIKLIFNSLLKNLIEFYDDDKNKSNYLEKTKGNNLNLYFKYDKNIHKK